MMDSGRENPQHFTLYRATATGACVMIQIHHPHTGEAVTAAELTCYQAARNFTTNWHKLTIKRGSNLFLTSDTAARMIEDGRIAPVTPRPLITCDEAANQRLAARWEAAAPRRKLLREQLIKAGRLKPIGDLEGPKA